MSNNKRKRNVLTLDNKLEVIKLREEGLPIDRIALQFNIGGSTVSEICKRRVEIEAAVEKNKKTGKIRKTMKESSKPDVENELYAWYLQHNEINSIPSQLEIIERAKLIHNSQLKQDMADDELDQWNPTKGWVVRFKERYGIKPKVVVKPKEIKDDRPSLSSQSALEAAEYLLEYINSHDFLLKDVITVRMIRDKIASEQDCQSSD